MATLGEDYDVVIVGGGVIGCTTAKELAPDHDVLLIEKNQIAGETTGKASGLISVVAEVPNIPELAHHSINFFREYDGTGDFEFTERPRVQLTPPELEETTRETVQKSSGNGFDTKFLDSNAFEDRYPGIFDLSEYVGAAVYEDAGWVDPYTFTMTLKDDAEDSGADIVTGVEVESVVIQNDEVHGVKTDAGDVRTDYVVVAAGWKTQTLLEGVLEIPVYPFRWQAITLEPGSELRDDYPMGYDPVARRYWRPEHNGNLHVGGGEYKVGNPGTMREQVNEEFKLETARKMPERLKDLENAKFVNGDTCPVGDATTPDKFPILDEPENGPDGLIVSTGYHIGGVMVAPAAGAGARALITGEEAPFSLNAFSMSRFEKTSTDFEFVGLMEAHTSYE